MSGHSHWQTVRRKKEANDSKKGAIFTKVAREIVIAVHEGGGGDPDSNMRLRMVLDTARTMGMPKDNIDRAIKRGTGDDKDAEEITQVVYEGYGPSGVAMLVDVVTDNRNRSVAAVRHALSRAGGAMANPGAVAWQFDRKGSISVPSSVDFEELFMVAVEAGASDVVQGDDEDAHEVLTDPAALHEVSVHLRESDIPVEDAELVMVPQNEVSLARQDAIKVLRLIDDLEELDDVRRVFTNLEMSDEVVSAYAAIAED